MKRGIILALCALICSWFAWGQRESGVSPQIVYKPSGPGSVAGLGESFQPDLNTGVATYELKLVVPPGRAGHQPSLSLVYNGGSGNALFGMGWNLNIPHIQRQTDKGLPTYTDQDGFIYSNNEELVPLQDGSFRMKNESEFLRFRRQVGDSWEVTSKNGTRFIYGQSATARIANAEGTFRWCLEQVIDTNGNVVRYAYTQDSGQVYLSDIRYNIINDTTFSRIAFSYEIRPDPFADYRSRHRVLTTQRCKSIEVFSSAQLVRKYELEYEPETIFSLLKRVTLIGRDQVTSLPPVSFAYTTSASTPPVPRAMNNSPNHVFGGDVEIIDFFGNSLPGLLVTSALEDHKYFENLGGGQWANEARIPNSPRVSMQRPGVRLADFNGDGFVDLVVQELGAYRYYPNLGRGVWEDPIVFRDEPDFIFGRENLKIFDINSDRLPDVCISNLSRSFTCWLNVGDRTWSQAFSIEAPEGVSFTNSRVQLADMNGDGQLDIVKFTGFGVSYWPMKGYNRLGPDGQAIFDSEIELQDAPRFPSLNDQPKAVDINGDGLADIVLVKAGEVRYWLNLGNNRFGPEQIIRGTPSLGGGFRFADMNGNGTSGIVWNDRVSGTFVYLDFTNGMKPNLLKTIDNGLGRRITIDYKTSTDYYVEARENANPWLRGLPVPVQVVSKVTVKDLNSNQEYVTEYEYRDGYYSGFHRQFRGFETVKKTEYGDETAPAKRSIYCFDVGQSEESMKGKVRKLDVLANDAPLSCERDIQPSVDGLFTREVLDYTTRTIQEGTDGRQVRFSFNSTKNTYVFEQTDVPKNIREVYQYDDYGNITQEFKYGLVEGDDLGVGNDEVLTYTEYAYNEAVWLLDRTKYVKKTDLAGNIVSEQKLYYDGPAWTGLAFGQVEKGNLMRREERLGPRGSGGSPCQDDPSNRCINTVRNRYDPYGNVTGIMDALGNPARLDLGHYRTIVYDTMFYTFPAEEHIHLEGNRELLARANYDPGFGIMREYRDFNNQLTQFFPDPLGRLEKIVKPGDTEAQPTVKYTYQLQSPVSYIETNQRERSGHVGTVDSRDYFDGLERKLQTKLRAEDGKFAVQNGVTFNQRQTAKENYLPYFDSQRTFDYSPVEITQPKVTMFYDALGREVQKTQPDASFSQTVYTPLQKTVYDEENTDSKSVHYNKPKTLTNDGLDRLIQVDERNGEEVYATTYSYDPLGKLVLVTDAQGNQTSFVYDGLSRKVEANEPDRGRTLFTYHDTSLLKETIDAMEQRISSVYDGANRIKTETFVVDGQEAPHATFHYDTERPTGLPADHPAISHTLGQLVYVDDRSGQSVFSYDARGRAVVNTRKIRETGAFYVTQFRYDAMDRLDRLTYPDGSYITHQYSQRGLLEMIPDFVNQIKYQASGQMEEMLYGNGVKTTRTYDTRQRLDELKTTRQTNIIQDLKHEYDRVGNLRAIRDRRTVIPEDMNGTACFGYDNLYRLTRVDGLTSPDQRCEQRAYYIDFAYDAIGNMTSKRSDRPEVNAGDMRYGEAGRGGPHAVTSAGSRQFQYDANGNMSEEIGTATYRWDPKDRLLSVTRNGVITDFSYDYTGARVKKATASETVYYINKYTELRNGQLIKYIFAGNHRVAEIDGAGQVVFNHSDHLSSSNIVTNSGGSITGNLEYYAFGQERMREGFLLPYRYTDKERDESTGLDYFSARYYTSNLGRFISTDPKPVKEKGLLNPQNLNPYSYALNNPLVYVDPNGLDSFKVGAEQKRDFIDKSFFKLPEGAGKAIGCSGLCQLHSNVEVGHVQAGAKLHESSDGVSLGPRGKLAGVEVSILGLLGNKMLGVFYEQKFEYLVAEGSLGLKKTSIGAGVGAKLFTSEHAFGLNLLGGSTTLSVEIGLGQAYSLHLGKTNRIEVSAGPVVGGFEASLGAAKGDGPSPWVQMYNEMYNSFKSAFEAWQTLTFSPPH